jgi:polyisoprenoid-binding protein YceI
LGDFRNGHFGTCSGAVTYDRYGLLSTVDAMAITTGNALLHNALRGCFCRCATAARHPLSTSRTSSTSSTSRQHLA